ncbi:heat-inducible transcriptional repressor HrcA [Paenibacillus antri]|uniref:Heat-inducible transcription repressor HrcA n=1 Tax=Paenibacillus antri TaxID=2582848 RepID=A0A5R9GB98_9BACL|nr:heat-inducible transcriptional repressor HrcA [Paenibacillus antri]TLS53742.1 heat-inducible transcriptional repressor HrcA [Paenibacillus antri]
MLSERQKMILSAIVDDYIRSAEPVGSRSISKRGDVGYSAATIRNEMSDLEELGFLEQPHTSAGRIPSNKGYRYYVDHLLSPGSLSPMEKESIKTFFENKIQEVEGVVQHAATILSSLTNYTAIVLGPETYKTTLASLQLIPLNERSAVAIIVTNTGHVENRTVTIPDGVPVGEIEKFVNVMNAKLKGVPLYRLRSKMYTELVAELSKHVAGYEELLAVVESVLEGDESDRLYLGGATNMLTQPEFKDVDKVKTILDLFDQTETMLRMFAATPAGIQVKIGGENTLEAINHCSIITASYSIEGQPVGTIGILGPTRMDYRKVIAVLDLFTKDLTNSLSRWYR